MPRSLMIALGIPILSNMWILIKSTSTLEATMHVGLGSTHLDHNQHQTICKYYQNKMEKDPWNQYHKHPKFRLQV
jgi:hypothetical protein